jgi:hypothetical protein
MAAVRTSAVLPGLLSSWCRQAGEDKSDWIDWVSLSSGSGWLACLSDIFFVLEACLMPPAAADLRHGGLGRAQASPQPWERSRRTTEGMVITDLQSLRMVWRGENA